MAQPTPDDDLATIGDTFGGALPGSPADADMKKKRSGAKAPRLGKFEGSPVLAARISITGAGDGLSEALDLSPETHHLGAMLYVLLEVEVTKIRHDPLKDTDGLARVHVTKASTGVVLDGDVAEEMLAGHKEAVEAARLDAERVAEDEAGVQRIPGTEDR
jgi:hypothetical protein